MTLQWYAAQIHDNTGTFYTAQRNYGPFNLVEGVKVTKIAFTGGLSFDSPVLESGSYFVSEWVQAIGYGPTGYTPADPGSAAGLEEAQWLYSGIGPPSSTAAIWAPNTDSAGFLDRWSLSFKVYPQLVVPSGGYDFYLVVSPTVTNAPNGFIVFGEFLITYVS